MSAALKQPPVTLPSAIPIVSMKASDFRAALKAVAPAISRRPSVPRLGYVLISADPRGISFTGENGEEQIVHTCEMGSATAGVALVPFHPLLRLAETFDAGATVELTQIIGEPAHNRLRIACGSREASLLTLVAADFPKPIFNPPHTEFSLYSARLLRLISKVSQSISRENERYYLNGIYLHTTEVGGVKVLRATATDGHRMSIADEPLPDGAETLDGIIIPRAAVSMALHAIKTADVVTFLIGSARSRMTFGDTAITFKHIDGKFPDYKRVIPTNLKTATRLPAKVLASATKAAQVVSTVPVVYELRHGSVMVSAENSSFGSFVELLLAEHSGEGNVIGFSGKYVLSLLATMSGAVEIKTAGNRDAAVFVDVDDTSVSHVLMPMRI